MGVFEKLFGRRPEPVNGRRWYELVNGYTPAWTTWNGELYENELVSASIEARATHISKAEIAFQGAARSTLKTNLKRSPNGWQTWGQFLARTSTILDLHNSVIIVPTMDEFGNVNGIYPVLPTISELVEYNGEPWLRFRFANGRTAAMELSKCGIMVKHQYKSDHFGEPNTALDNTMKLIDIQNQGITEGVKNAASFRFMATASNFTNSSDLTRERAQFTKDNLTSGGGLLLFPHTYKDIKQIDSKPFVVDDKQMEQIQTRVFNYYGVNQDVLQNKAYGDAWSAFYEGAVEPFLIQFSDVVSKMLFTPRELADGNRIMATSNRLQYMSTQDKAHVSEVMADRGLMTRNEIRSIWNLPMLPDDIGNELPIRGEYYAVGKDDSDGE